MSTKSNTASQTQTETQTQAQRERISLDAYIQDLVSPETGEVLGKGILLDFAGYLPAREDGRKATFGGLLANFVDPTNGQPCLFEGKNGEMIAGSAPVRFFGEDADVLDEGWGERPAGCSFGLALNQGATASVYRAEDGAIMFLVLGTKDVAQCGWVRGARAPKPKSF